MGFVRTAQASRLQLPVLSVDLYTTGATRVPCGISRNRVSLFGRAANTSTSVLYETTDDGTTWTTVKDFTSIVPSCVIQGCVETDDGEMLVFANSSAATNGIIFKSSGWTTSHTTATWTVKLTTVGGRWSSPWSMHSWTFGDDYLRAGTSAVGFIMEYGVQTTSSGSQTDKGIRGYLTTDYGSTWTQVVDLTALYPGVFPMHGHNAAYDPWWDRLWLLFGDTAAFAGALTNSIPTKAQILYSDDRGTTWTALPLPSEMQISSGLSLQSTTIALTKDSIMLGSDNYPGMVRIPRTGYRQVASTGWQSFDIGMWNGTTLIHTHFHQNRRQPGAPILASHTSQTGSVASAMYASVDGGETFVPVWDDSTLRGSNKGIASVWGPTRNGKIVANLIVTSGSSAGLLRGELLVPAPGLNDATMTVTGDGTTTAFTYAHGLGVKPNKLLAAPWKANPITSVTADATNITVTFTTAPANAASVPVALRFGP